MLTDLDQAGQTGVDRRPRGQNRQGTAALQVTASLTSDELAIFEDLMKQAQQKGKTVTRRQAVIAALTVATRATTS